MNPFVSASRAVRRATTDVKALLLQTSDWRFEHHYVVNADNARRKGGSYAAGQKQLRRELEAMASSAPAFIFVVEGIGNVLPELPHMDRVFLGDDASSENVMIYVAKRFGSRSATWHRLTLTWAKRNKGRHISRSILTTWGGRMRIIGFHAPPEARDSQAAQLEHERELIRLATPRANPLSRERPMILAGDGNARPADNRPGSADTIAEAIGGQYVGRRIDFSVVRGAIEILRSRYLEVLPGGVHFDGDHGHVQRVDWAVPAVWLPER